MLMGIGYLEWIGANEEISHAIQNVADTSTTSICLLPLRHPP